MKRVLVILAVFFFLALLSSYSVRAEDPPTDRFATCDACGYCPIIDVSTGACNPYVPPTGGATSEEISNPVPGNWKACVRCLYPSLYPPGSNPDPATCDTVRVVGNAPITPVRGYQYTMIGCITSTGGFGNNKGTGASSFVQAIFDFLVFRIIGGIALLSLMYGGFLVITSQAEPERLNYGKRVVMGAVIGLIFVLGSVFIVNIIGSGILRIPGFTP